MFANLKPPFTAFIESSTHFTQTLKVDDVFKFSISKYLNDLIYFSKASKKFIYSIVYL